MIQARSTTEAAGSVWPGVGELIPSVRFDVETTPGSVVSEKSEGRFVSVQLASRSRIRPGPGAAASPKVVFPGSQFSVPRDVAWNLTGCMTISLLASEAAATPGLGGRRRCASPGDGYRGERG